MGYNYVENDFIPVIDAGAEGKMAYLCFENRRKTILERESLAGSNMRQKYNERGIFLGVTKKATVFRDPDFKAFSADGHEWDGYYSAVKSAFPQERLYSGPEESLLREVYSLRAKLFGDRPYSALWDGEGKQTTVAGIDQSNLCERVWNKDTFVFYLSSPEYKADFSRDLKRASDSGKKIYVLVFPDDPVLPRPVTAESLASGVRYVPLTLKGQSGVCDLEEVPYDAALADSIYRNDAALIAYGEDGLISARGLRVPADVRVRPVGLFARAMTNLFTRPAVSRIYVPAGFDITPYITLKWRTKLTYYHLAVLAGEIGDRAYTLTPEQAASLAPDLFFRFYDDHIPPVRSDGEFDGNDLYRAAELFWQKKLSSLKGIRPIHACFDKKDFTKVEPDWNAAEKRDHLLVDGVVVSPGTNVRVLTFDGKAVSPREYFYDELGNKRKIVTNFTFFFTPKLVTIYNELRRDRPKERIGGFSGTVGYSLFKTDGKRHETIPPYAKPCVAAGKNGFTSFTFRAGGGKVEIGGETFRWEKENVNEERGDITLYTPLLSAKDEEKDPRSYVLTVGDGALNVSIVGEEILCIRRGDVTLPCIGAVLSLKGREAERLERLLGAPDPDGYYAVGDLAPVITMDKPDEFTQEEWDSFDWIVGGGIKLIDGEEEINEDNYLELFRAEGWLSPLSRQTQETDQHVISLQPRTAVGITKKGELAVLVYSGRSNVSAGANYFEMCRAAKLLVPDLRSLTSFDGGGSSVFGLVEGKVFTEINLPAITNESTLGMGRQISSFIVIDID